LNQTEVVRRASILALFAAVFVTGVMLAVAVPGASRGGDGEGGVVATNPCAFADPLDEGAIEDGDTDEATAADEGESADDAAPVPQPEEEGCVFWFPDTADCEPVGDESIEEGEASDGAWTTGEVTCFSLGGYLIGSDDNP
jgi:hypothetical protein